MPHDSSVLHARRILALDPKELQKLFGDKQSHNPYTTVMALPWGSYKPVTQVRKTFQDVQELAESISLQGLLQPQTVFAFPLPVAQRYVDAVNILHGSNDTLDCFQEGELPNGEKVIFILIAGERRHRALTYLHEHGCKTCNERHPNTAKNGMCLARHFKDQAIPASVKVGFTPYDALTTQYAENTHHRPKADEEAIGFRVFFELMRAKDSTITVSEFARQIGHNEGRVRAALRYTQLPEFVQLAVAEGKIPFSTALILERYHNVRQDESELRFWLLRAIGEMELSSKRLAEMLATDLQYWKIRQTGLFRQSDVELLQEKKTRLVFDQNINRGLERISGFLFGALQAIRTGTLGGKDSPFAAGSVAHAVVKIYRILDMIVPAISSEFRKKDLKEIEEIKKRLEPEIRFLEGSDD